MKITCKLLFTLLQLRNPETDKSSEQGDGMKYVGVVDGEDDDYGDCDEDGGN